MEYMERLIFAICNDLSLGACRGFQKRCGAILIPRSIFLAPFWPLGVALRVRCMTLKQSRCGGRKFRCGTKEIYATKGRRLLIINNVQR